jgi:hypothetical protein
MAIQDVLRLACLGDCLACCSYCSNVRASCDSYMLAAILGFFWVVEDWEEPGAGGAPGSSQCWGDRSVKVLQSGHPRDGDATAVVALPLRDLNVIHVHQGDSISAESSCSAVSFCGDGTGGGADG